MHTTATTLRPLLAASMPPHRLLLRLQIVLKLLAVVLKRNQTTELADDGTGSRREDEACDSRLSFHALLHDLNSLRVLLL